ncbi:hypothetical protein BU23DRAFT_8444 [Bimuria novae-zelandiae CBS 107.79]|uniref:Uncharacterized protein n=1 Tax=Bimuria novae-zelandiae CBS 107.79 TaxID=1447943 RepID=A0A6A5VU44_9PLEO|nr:hypothetical protein BU23DRAFT_8444 [Bimuria novae-zelandiae CBS 107.79]
MGNSGRHVDEKTQSFLPLQERCTRQYTTTPRVAQGQQNKVILHQLGQNPHTKSIKRSPEQPNNRTTERLALIMRSFEALFDPPCLFVRSIQNTRKRRSDRLFGSNVLFVGSAAVIPRRSQRLAAKKG